MVDKPGVVCFPNPARNSVYFELIGELSNYAEISIFDLQGKLVKRKKVNSRSKKVEIGVSEIKSGIYYYSLSSVDGIISSNKLIITN